VVTPSETVRDLLADHQEALTIAFERIVSGRRPERRGNGLKFVRSVIHAHADRGLVRRSLALEAALLRLHPSRAAANSATSPCCRGRNTLIRAARRGISRGSWDGRTFLALLGN
jgi:hypothetical protein